MESQLQLIKDKTEFHHYAFLSPYEPKIIAFCRYLKDKYGWQEFNFKDKAWRFSLLAIAEELQLQYPEMVVPADLRIEGKEEETEQIQKLSAQEVKERGRPTIQIKGLKQDLYDYQKLGVEFLTASGGRAVLADAMGVGKTAQAIGFIVHNKILKTLVICPASVKFAWENEVHKWTKLRPWVIHGKSADISTKAFMEAMNDHDVFIINYDLLKKYHSLLQNMRFGCLIVDEFHAIKNTTAIRSKLTKAIASRIPKVILLSGTPMLNRPIELFNGLNIIDSKTWPNWFKFSVRYADGHRDRFGWNSSGASNVEELKEKIAPYFLRRTKAEVLSELPPKSFIDIPVELAPDVQKIYESAERDLARFLRVIKNKSTDEIRKALAAEKLVRLNALRQITTSGKLEAAVEIIDQIIENEEKVVVFSVYNAPLEELKARYGAQAVLFTGKTTIEDRGALIEAFQKNPKIKVFLGGTRAAGVGITLTSASNALFIDYDWVPAIMEQAADRIHRIGQTAESVNIYQIYAKDTIDDYLVKLLKEKQKLVDQIIEGKSAEEAEQSVINSVFGQLSLKHGKEEYEESPF